MTDVGLLVAFAAGVLALLSPCSALLLPSFFAYAFASHSAQLRRTAVFYLGLLLTLVPLGMGASAASTLLYGNRQLLVAIAGWFIVALGLVQILGRSFAVPFAGRMQQAASRATSRSSGWASTLALGAVYGLAGFCSGPILGAILTIAATRHSPLQGGLLLAVYALGMAAPLFVLAALWDRYDLGHRRWVRGTMLTLGPVRVHSSSGVLFVTIGALFLRFDGTAGITGVLGLGDTTDLEADAQQNVSTWLSAMPAWSVPAAVALIAAVVALRRAARSTSRQP